MFDELYAVGRGAVCQDGCVRLIEAEIIRFIVTIIMVQDCVFREADKVSKRWVVLVVK